MDIIKSTLLKFIFLLILISCAGNNNECISSNFYTSLPYFSNDEEDDDQSYNRLLINDEIDRKDFLFQKYKDTTDDNFLETIAKIENKDLQSGKWIKRDPDIEKGIKFLQDLMRINEKVLEDDYKLYGIKNIVNNIVIFEKHYQRNNEINDSEKVNFKKYIKSVLALKMILGKKDEAGDSKYVGIKDGISKEYAKKLDNYLNKIIASTENIFPKKEIDDKDFTQFLKEKQLRDFASVSKENFLEEIEKKWTSFEDLREGTWDTFGRASLFKEEKKISNIIENTKNTKTELEFILNKDQNIIEKEIKNNHENYKKLKSNFIDTYHMISEIIFKKKYYIDDSVHSNEVMHRIGLEYVGPAWTSYKSEGISVSEANSLFNYLYFIANAFVYIESKGKMYIPLQYRVQIEELGYKDFLSISDSDYKFAKWSEFALGVTAIVHGIAEFVLVGVLAPILPMSIVLGTFGASSIALGIYNLKSASYKF